MIAQPPYLLMPAIVWSLWTSKQVFPNIRRRRAHIRPNSRNCAERIWPHPISGRQPPLPRQERCPAEEVRVLFRDVLTGIAYCHSRGVAHRDIKLANCLLAMGATRRVGKAQWGDVKSLSGGCGPGWGWGQSREKRRSDEARINEMRSEVM